ncbi:MAG: exo-alpha-sialidase [Planctomycetes bacterium]|nr:exo-alpha-sialidase [Planctomycetota bacterium]
MFSTLESRLKSGVIRNLVWLVSVLSFTGTASAQDSEFPWIDLDSESQRQVVVDRESGQYLGHPTTLLLEDGKTILCVYPKGHGKGPIIYKRSTDGGVTWSDRLPTPVNWATSQETPTLHRVIDADGKKRILLFSGLYPVRLAISEDDGINWSDLKAVGNWGGIVTMASVIAVPSTPGKYIALFHDDGRFFGPKPSDEKGIFTLYQSVSTDGGLTWGQPTTIFASREIHLCEPGAVVSPDGKQFAVLLRENSRRSNSHIIFSNDEGSSWTSPVPTPDSLNGDRHTAKYLPDGRLFISFRDVPRNGQTSPTKGDWVAWVGTYSDLQQGKQGDFRIRLKRNFKGADCAYPGVEVLSDSTVVTTTYGHWTPNEPPYILSVRLKLAECDQRLTHR